MDPDVRPLVAGNWKMNGLTASLSEIEAMRGAVEKGAAGAAEVLVCPPATLLAPAAQILRGGKLALGAQDCHPAPSGAFTGDISAEMIKDAGGELRYRRAFRAARRPRRDRRAGAGESRGRS